MDPLVCPRPSTAPGLRILQEGGWSSRINSDSGLRTSCLRLPVKDLLPLPFVLGRSACHRRSLRGSHGCVRPLACHLWECDPDLHTVSGFVVWPI